MQKKGNYMITIKTIDKNNAELNINEGTPYMTILLGVEMMIEELVKTTGLEIDQLLGDLKIIYERDNERKQLFI